MKVVRQDYIDYIRLSEVADDDSDEESEEEDEL